MDNKFIKGISLGLLFSLPLWLSFFGWIKFILK
jgi:hypothetical protein